MAEPLRTLSPSFVREIQWAIQQVRKLVSGSRRDVVDPTRVSPDIEFCYLPDGETIAGMTDTSMAGKELEVWTIDRDAVPGDANIDLVAVTDKTFWVYNNSTEPLAGPRLLTTGLHKRGFRVPLVSPCEANTGFEY